MHIDKRRLYHLDWYLILNGLALLAIGLMNLVSATRSIESGPYSLLLKQMVALCVGIAALFLVLSYDYRLIASYARHFYGATLFFIIFVLIIGTIAGGAKRWLTIAGIAFQPSELMKPVMVLMLANMLYQRKKENETFSCPCSTFSSPASLS